jgi:hypothetical protein
MNKVKWCFSLLLSFIIVGILSNAAFASDLYNLNTVQNGSGLEVSFTGSSSTNPADVEGTQFDIVLKDGTKVVNTYNSISLNSSNQGTLNIQSGVLTLGKVYTIELYHTVDTAHSSLLAKASAVVTVAHNSSLLNQANSPKTDDGGTATLDKNGSGLANSNETGINPTSKKRSGQKMHGFYQNNTNSCASCHQTHTAANGESLLFKDGTYSTCSACHDGTTGAYNSFSAMKSGTENGIAGTFNIADDSAHGSLHQADGTLKVSSAPGGNSSTDPSVTGSNVYKATWGQNFDCSSCHSAHGGGSSEENNLNTNPMGWGGIAYSSTGDQKNGKLFLGQTIQTTVPTGFSTPYILVRRTVTDADLPKTATGDNDKTKLGYLLERAGVTSGMHIIQTYRWDGNEYIPDYSLWLRDSGHVSAPFANANTILYNGSTDITAQDMTVVWKDGFAFGTGVDNVTKYDLSIGIDVETNKSDAAALYDVTDKNYVPDSGVQMTMYCTACHTDYSTDPETGKPGTLTAYHRHDEVSDQLTCARCHFAHGTKSVIMKDASDTLAKTSDTISDTNHSSALRRYIDMDSCYTSGCHSKTDSSNPLYMQWSY